MRAAHVERRLGPAKYEISTENAEEFDRRYVSLANLSRQVGRIKNFDAIKKELAAVGIHPAFDALKARGYFYERELLALWAGR
ncbi:hypothetical protein V1291_003102 [Nitrobacteraceae bacterium AZCC 1564]